MSNFTLSVNGKTHTVDVEPSTPLLYILRNDLGLQGPGSVAGWASAEHARCIIKGEAVRSCIRPMSAVQGAEITTLEGLARTACCIRSSRPGLTSRCRSAASARTDRF